LCSCDYRAATFARGLGVIRGLGIDVITNLPNIMQRGDILIFGSDEPSNKTKQFMQEYCTLLYEIGTDVPLNLVDDKYLIQNNTTKRQKAFFFGDDDYSNILLKKLCSSSKLHDTPLLLGHYFFLGDDEKLKLYFKTLIDEEDYFDTIKNTKYLLTSSVNSVFQSLASGNYPVFYQREDKKDIDLKPINNYNIPIINGDNLDDIFKKFDDIILNYPKIKKYENFNIKNIEAKISQEIKKRGY
jgi:hypothetical protein